MMRVSPSKRSVQTWESPKIADHSRNPEALSPSMKIDCGQTVWPGFYGDRKQRRRSPIRRFRSCRWELPPPSLHCGSEERKAAESANSYSRLPVISVRTSSQIHTAVPKIVCLTTMQSNTRTTRRIGPYTNQSPVLHSQSGRDMMTRPLFTC